MIDCGCRPTPFNENRYAIDSDLLLPYFSPVLQNPYKYDVGDSVFVYVGGHFYRGEVSEVTTGAQTVTGRTQVGTIDKLRYVVKVTDTGNFKGVEAPVGARSLRPGSAVDPMDVAK